MSADEKLILSFELTESARTRHYWLSRAGGQHATEADVLIAPWEKFRDDKDLFPQGTAEFFKFLQKARPDIAIAIAASPEEYREVTLHAHEFRLPTLLIKETVVAIIVGVCAEYLMHHQAHPVDDIAQLELIVEGKDYPHKCISAKYKGPVGKLPERIIEEVDRCLSSIIEKAPAAKQSSSAAPPAKRNRKATHPGDD